MKGEFDIKPSQVVYTKMIIKETQKLLGNDPFWNDFTKMFLLTTLKNLKKGDEYIANIISKKTEKLCKKHNCLEIFSKEEFLIDEYWNEFDLKREQATIAVQNEFRKRLTKYKK